MALMFTLVQVDALEREYGTIRSDTVRFDKERGEALARRDNVLSEISQHVVEADGLRKSIADLTAQRDRLGAEVEQRNSTIADDLKKIADNQEQLKSAAATIATAAQADKSLATLRAQNSDLQKQIAANQTKFDQTNDDVDQAEQKKHTADQALAIVESNRADREADIVRLNGQIKDLDDKKRQVTDLDARATNLNALLIKTGKDLSDKQRLSHDLDSDISRLQDQASMAKSQAAKNAADIAQQTSAQADLTASVAMLESKKASLTGDLTSLQNSTEKTRADMAAAEGRLSAAQQAVTEAQKAIPILKAQLSDVQSDVAATSAQRDALKAEVAELLATKAKGAIDRSDADRLSAEKAAMEKQVGELNGRVSELGKEADLRESDLNSVKAELAELNGRKGALVQEIAALSDAKQSRQPQPKPQQPEPVQPSADVQSKQPE